MRNKHEIETCTCTFGFYYINFTRYWPSIIINFFPRKHPNIAACQEMLKWQKGVLSYYYTVKFFPLGVMIRFLQTWPNPVSFLNSWSQLTRQYLMEACDVTFPDIFLSGRCPVKAPICSIRASSPQIFVIFEEKYCLQ